VLTCRKTPINLSINFVIVYVLSLFFNVSRYYLCSQTDIERSLPSGNPVSALQGSSVISSLHQQIDEVQSIKESRDKIESELKDVKCDIGNL